MPRPSLAPAALAWAALLAPVPGAALAQDISQAPALAPVVITATRVATPRDQVASSVTVITGQDMADHQWRTLADALMAAPGVSLVQTGGPGGLTSVFIRGADADQTKVIIDGIDANDPSTGAFDFGQVLTAGLARVEILRGPQSSLYGADALGGVINIVTKSGRGPPRLDASVEGGSFDTFEQSVRLAGGGAHLGVALDVAHFLAGDTPVTPPALLAPGEPSRGDRYDNLTAAAKIDFQASPAAGLGLVARYVAADLRSTGENFDVFPAIPDAAQTDQRTAQWFARGEARLSLLHGRFENVLGLGYAGYHTVIQAPDDGLGVPPATLDDGDRLKIDWQATLTVSSRATLVLGAEDDRDRLIDTPVSAKDGDQGAFVEVQARPVSGLSIAASARYDHDERFGGAATWRIAPAYVIGRTGTRLEATYGTGFKAPSLTQLFVSFPAFHFFADPNLAPETSRGWDAGFEQPLEGGRVRFGATWFRQAIRDLIEENATFTSYANVGRASARGVESFLAIEPSHAVVLRADYTYTFARDDLTGAELLRRPRDKVEVSALWRPAARLNASASLTYVGAWVDGNRDFSVPRQMASPFATVDIAANYELGGGVAVYARVDNLLDRRYQDPVGFDKPGIGVFAGVRIDLAARAAGAAAPDR